MENLPAQDPRNVAGTSSHPPATQELHNLLDAAGVAGVLINPDLTVRQATPAAAQLLGLPPGEFGQPLASLKLGLDYPVLAADVEKVLTTREPFEREVPAGDRWFRARLVPCGAEGDSAAALIVDDISGQRRAELAWHTSEQSFRIALQSSEMAAWDYDVRAGTVSWNEQHFRLFGLEPSDQPVTPDFFMSFVHPQDAVMVAERLREAVEEGAIFRAEFRITRKDTQEVRWMSGFGKALASENGRATRISGVMYDMTARRTSEQALAAAEERLRLIVDSAVEHAILSLDKDLHVTSWNTGAEAIFGYTREEMLGRSVATLFTEEDQAAGIPQQEAQTAAAQGRANDNRWSRRKDGHRFWASGSMLPMRTQPGGDVVGFVKILRDETPARESREALERNQRELWAALQEKETARAEAEAARAEAEAAGEAKNNFLAVLSHELRTPLTPVALVAQSLGRRKDLPDSVREALAMIRRNVQLEARLVDDLLDITKIDRGKMGLNRHPVEMNDVIRRAVETTEPELQGRRQVLTVDLGAERQTLGGDAGRLQQVVWNLLKNASKFTPEGGKIRIRTWNESDRLLVEVQDSGIGIEAEALPRIFEAFKQGSASVSQRFGGLGLGLAIARAIVAAHDGELRAASEGVGHGATFTVSLPLLDGREGAASERGIVRTAEIS